jgi:hypothetical protein
MLRRLVATVALVVGIAGALVGAAPSASADHLPPLHLRLDADGHGTCLLRINVTLFGNTIGTGPNCLI